MYVAVLGRQPAIGLAELESVFGSENVAAYDSVATVAAGEFDLSRFGGVKKAGRVLIEFTSQGIKADKETVYDTLLAHIGALSGKVTIGFSSYISGVDVGDLKQIGTRLKTQMKKQGKSLRLVPNTSAELSTATSHHNRLGLADNKIEVILIRADKKMLVALSIGAQNISAYAARDQKRPARDMYIGMLPPKLAQTIINLATGERKVQSVLDPFCGTGVLLQEALLMGYDVIGTDLSEKMVEYSRTNLEWLLAKKRMAVQPRHQRILLHEGDAMEYQWEKFDTVACEAYLGQPFSAPPSAKKLVEVQQTCRRIISGFLKNLATQIEPDTRLCIAIPAWRRTDGSFTRLNLLDSLGRLGYNLVEFKHARQSDLLYHRSNQIVARELLVLRRSK